MVGPNASYPGLGLGPNALLTRFRVRVGPNASYILELKLGPSALLSLVYRVGVTA